MFAQNASVDFDDVGKPSDMSIAGRPDVLADASRRVPGLVLDSLEFLDAAELERSRAQVEALIMEEMGRMGAESAGRYQAELPPLPPRAAAALADTSNLPSAGAHASSARAGAASLEAPPTPPASGDAASALEWELSRARAAVAAEAQLARALNVDLSTRYGVEAWQAHLAGLATLEAAARDRVAALRKAAESTAAGRRAAQERVRARLEGLGKREAAARDAATTVTQAVADAQAEVRRLKRLARGAGLLADEDDEADSNAR